MREFFNSFRGLTVLSVIANRDEEDDTPLSPRISKKNLRKSVMKEDEDLFAMDDEEDEEEDI